MSNTSIARRVLVQLTQEEEMWRIVDQIRKNGDAICARVRARVAQQSKAVLNKYIQDAEAVETNGHVDQPVNG